MQQPPESAPRGPEPSAETEARERQRRGPQPNQRRIKNLDRFNYWKISTINAHADGMLRTDEAALALDHSAHAGLENWKGNQHRSGDPNAIFEYAEMDAWCFRSAWFVEQLEAWRDAGDDAQLLKIMRRFARNTTKVPTKELRTLVERDQRIFRRIITRPAGQSLNRRFGDLANEFGLSEDTIREVHERYSEYLRTEQARGTDVDTALHRLAEMLRRFP